MQRFVMEKDLCNKRKLETKQVEYSKDSHTPCIIMKFPWLPLAQVRLLNNLLSNSPSLCKQVGVGDFANVSSLLLSLFLIGRSGCPEGFPLHIQMEKQAPLTCHLHKVTEWDNGSSRTSRQLSPSVPCGQQWDPSGVEWGWGMAVDEWTLKWRKAHRPHWVPLENDAMETSFLVESCSVNLWHGGCPRHVLTTAMPLVQVFSSTCLTWSSLFLPLPSPSSQDCARCRQKYLPKTLVLPWLFLDRKILLQKSQTSYYISPVDMLC